MRRKAQGVRRKVQGVEGSRLKAQRGKQSILVGGRA